MSHQKSNYLFIASLFLLCFSGVYCSVAFGSLASNPIKVTVVDFGQTPDDTHYCIDIFVGYDEEKGCGIPTRLGPQFINRYLQDIHGSPNYYIRFAYSEAQPNGYWPSDPKKTCTFVLDRDAKLSVTIAPSGCGISQR